MLSIDVVNQAALRKMFAVKQINETIGTNQTMSSSTYATAMTVTGAGLVYSINFVNVNSIRITIDSGTPVEIVSPQSSLVYPRMTSGFTLNLGGLTFKTSLLIEFKGTGSANTNYAIIWGAQ
jgi:hypothetical protein